MWGNDTFAAGTKSIKKYWEKIDIGKNYWLRKENNDAITREKFFDRPAEHK